MRNSTIEDTHRVTQVVGAIAGKPLRCKLFPTTRSFLGLFFIAVATLVWQPGSAQPEQQVLIPPTHAAEKIADQDVTEVSLADAHELDKADPQVGCRKLEILFLTSRVQQVDQSGSSHFTVHSGPATGGAMTVTIPDVHQKGKYERPRFGWKEEPRKHICISSTVPLAKEQFANVLRRKATTSPTNKVLILVHGFNFDFNEAAYRAAQFAHDAQFDGTVIMFSWPSLGQPFESSYFIDVAQAMASVPRLANFLVWVKTVAPEADLSVLAHSLGCRLTCHALSSIAASDSLMGRPLLDDLVLAAPDMDRDAFVAVSNAAVRKVARRVTVYVSAQDTALQCSSRLHGDRVRLGDASSGVPVIDGADVVDVTELSSGHMASHMYFTASSDVMRDIRAAINGAPLSQRRRTWPQHLAANK